MVRIIIGLLIIASFDAIAIRPPMSMACMVKNSDAIVIGRYVGSKEDPVYADRLGNIYLANFKNLGSLKGFGIEMRELKNGYSLLWRKGDPESASFRMNTDYIIFLKYSEIGPYILNGSSGVLQKNSSSADIDLIRKQLDEKFSGRCY